MKNRLFVFIVIVVCFPGLLPAQEVSVRILSQDEPLPYAIVYVNGEPVGATDSTGVKRFPGSDLNVGDTITASLSVFEEERRRMTVRTN